jgi:MarR family transcriptional regulator, organic hydroperoxide resistance regulator
MAESKQKSKPAEVRGVEPLMPALARAFKRAVALVERESGVPGMWWFVMRVLSRRDGLSQGEFVREHEVADPSSVTRTAQALEAEGWIRRERDPGDNRVVRMYLTDEGRRVIEERLPRVYEEIEMRAHVVMSEKELAEFSRMLGLFAEAMKEGEK